MKLLTHTFDLPLKHAFTISRETTHTQPTLIVELSDGQISGYGEATSNTYYGMTIPFMRQSLELVRQEIEKLEDLQPADFWEQMKPHFSDCPFALCALDQAAYDYWGKKHNKPVYRLLGLNLESLPASNFTIGIDTVDIMVEKMNEMPGWPIYKIKLGTHQDIEIIEELRKHTDAIFRVDANCGWSVEEAIDNSVALKDLGVEFLEQPLPAEDVEGYQVLYENSALPLIADESCITEADVAKCHLCFHGINIKLVKCGGITPALRMISQARELGMKVMVGCMTESTVGISAIAQILPLLDYVDMDGAALLSEDIATGARVDHGICIYPPIPGNGVQLLGQDK